MRTRPRPAWASAAADAATCVVEPADLLLPLAAGFELLAVLAALAVLVRVERAGAAAELALLAVVPAEDADDEEPLLPEPEPLLDAAGGNAWRCPPGMTSCVPTVIRSGSSRLL